MGSCDVRASSVSLTAATFPTMGKVKEAMLCRNMDKPPLMLTISSDTRPVCRRDAYLRVVLM